jgi:transposase
VRLRARKRAPEARSRCAADATELLKAYVKRGKNDAADTATICEAVSRLSMRFVPIKNAEQQAALICIERQIC